MAKAKQDEVVPDEILERNAVVLSMNARQDAVTAMTNLGQLQEKFQDELLEWSDIEPSFQVATKETFEDNPFVIGGFRLNQSKTVLRRDESGDLVPGEFISLLVAGYDPDTLEFNTPWVIVNDGSTGIAQQLRRLMRKIDPEVDLSISEFNYAAAEVKPIKCANGLRRSDYTKETPDGVVQATTWYIA